MSTINDDDPYGFIATFSRDTEYDFAAHFEEGFNFATATFSRTTSLINDADNWGESEWAAASRWTSVDITAINWEILHEEEEAAAESAVKTRKP